MGVPRRGQADAQVLPGSDPWSLAPVARGAAPHDPGALERAEVVAHRRRGGARERGGLGRGQLATVVVQGLDHEQARRVGDRADRGRLVELDDVAAGVRHGLSLALDSPYPKHILRNMPFRTSTGLPRTVKAIALGRGISFLGDEVALLTMAFRARSELGHFGVASIMIAGALPLLVLAPFSGLLVDRVRTRPLLVTATIVQASLCVALGVRPRGPPRAADRAARLRHRRRDARMAGARAAPS